LTAVRTSNIAIILDFSIEMLGVRARAHNTGDTKRLLRLISVRDTYINYLSELITLVLLLLLLL
jgi:hypothetical protein